MKTRVVALSAQKHLGKRLPANLGEALDPTGAVESRLLKARLFIFTGDDGAIAAMAHDDLVGVKKPPGHGTFFAEQSDLHFVCGSVRRFGDRSHDPNVMG